MPGTPTPIHGIATMAGGADAINTIDDTHNAAMATIDGKLTKVFELPINWVVPGVIFVPSGQVDVIPPAYVPIRAGQTVKLARVRYGIGAGTSVSFKLQRNGVDATGFTGLTATTTIAETDPTDITLSDDDRIQVVVTAVSGNPQNLTVEAILEITV